MRGVARVARARHTSTWCARAAPTTAQRKPPRRMKSQNPTHTHARTHALQVTDLTDVPFVERELMLVKVSCSADQRRQLSDLAAIFHGSVCDVSPTTLTIELQGKGDKMAALQRLLEPYGACLSCAVCLCAVQACAVAAPHQRQQNAVMRDAGPRAQLSRA